MTHSPSTSAPTNYMPTPTLAMPLAVLHALVVTLSLRVQHPTSLSAVPPTILLLILEHLGPRLPFPPALRCPSDWGAEIGLTKILLGSRAPEVGVDLGAIDPARALDGSEPDIAALVLALALLARRRGVFGTRVDGRGVVRRGAHAALLRDGSDVDEWDVDKWDEWDVSWESLADVEAREAQKVAHEAGEEQAGAPGEATPGGGDAYATPPRRERDIPPRVGGYAGDTPPLGQGGEGRDGRDSSVSRPVLAPGAASTRTRARTVLEDKVDGFGLAPI
ncbi:hypothetical protein CspeluHIS016_0900020 [Cutaneotrichosporon spelunceum]|uniref:Uncharacterized protein n=1 Tax=Cutaneotrichosporon spelunceum TaxID=1672016 RepID=A0AAD3U099_9TREE|nr:hypothetical protein CspeluHIS016_0900020 [Cutaneotrichosporon spelunceum]